MKSITNLVLATALVASSMVAVAPGAMARDKHHHHEMCLSDGDKVGLLFVGAALGAVTGGVGSAVAWGSAYAVGGAAVGGGVGLLLGAAHSHHHHCK